MTFGTRMRQLRIARKLTIQGIAKELGFSTPYISDIERDRRAPPRKHFDRLFAALRLEPHEIDDLRNLGTPDVCPTCGAQKRFAPAFTQEDQ